MKSMYVTKMEPVEVEACGIRVVVPVRYEDDQESLQGCPGFDGETLDIILDLDGTVRGWDGVSRHIHLKVCDEGTYSLLDGIDDPIASVSDYVPHCLPQEYGDYLVMRVQESGDIERWAPTATAIERCFLGGGADV